MILTYLILSIIAALAVWAWINRIHLKLSWQMRGVFPFVPFVGIAWRFLIQENLEVLDHVLRRYANVEEPIGLWVGPKFMIYVDNAKDVETLLTSPNCVRDEMYQYIKDVSGVDGLFTSKNPRSKRHRRLVSPSFSEKSALSYVTVFARLSMNLVKDLKEMVNKEPFDIRRYISDCTLDAFVEAICGSGVEDKERLIFHRNIKLGQSLIGKRFFIPWYQSEWVWKLTGLSEIANRVAKDTEEIFDKAMENAIHKQSPDVTFLQRMIRIAEDNDEFTIEDVKAETIHTFIAGTDTSAAAIAYTVLLLAMHPEHQERVFEELKVVLPTKETPIRSEQISQLIYLDLCIKEALRLFPVVSLMAKQVKYGTVNLGGCDVPPGVTIVIGVNRLHRKLKYWGPDANKFNPIRFHPGNIEYKVHRYAYVPFSEGSRNCVGYKYAYAAMKSILASVLRNYRLTTPLKLEDLRVRMRVNIFLLNKHMVQIHERND